MSLVLKQKSLIFLSQMGMFLCHFAPECFLIIFFIFKQLLVQRTIDSIPSVNWKLVRTNVWIRCPFYFIGIQITFCTWFYLRQ